MATRGEQLADQFEQAVRELEKTIEQSSDEQWQKTCGAEGWTVAQTAQHVAGQFYAIESEYIFAAADGKPLPAYTWDDINAKNDGRAAKNAGATKQEVLDLLRSDGEKMARYVRGLSDEQLDRKSELALAGGATVTTQQLIEGGVLIDHVNSHLRSIRAAM
jgi:hypothetical protein